MNDFGRSPVRKPASNANRHAAICAIIGALLIWFALGATFAEVPVGVVGWLFICGMLALVLANLVMMES